MKLYDRMFLFVVLALLLMGCAPSGLPPQYYWASVGGSQLERAEAGEEFYFNVPVDAVPSAKTPIPVRVSTSGQVQAGWLRFELRDPAGQVVWNSGQIGPGDFSITTEYPPDPAVAGDYKLGLVWGTDTAARYDLSWHRLKLNPAVLIPGVGMILVALAFVLYALRRGLGWRYLLLGALGWTSTVALKFVFAVLVNPLVYRMSNFSETHLFAFNNLLLYLYIGALTGVFEAGGLWLALRKNRWGQAHWGQALAFGIGFGAFEALLLGLLSTGSGLVGLLVPDSLPVVTLGTLAQSGQLVMGLAPVAERISVIFAHIFACLLIFTAIVGRKARWGWLAILYKTLLDAPAAFAAFWGIETPEKIWTIEAVVAVFGLVGLIGTLWLAQRYPKPPLAPEEESVPTVP